MFGTGMKVMIVTVNVNECNRERVESIDGHRYDSIDDVKEMLKTDKIDWCELWEFVNNFNDSDDDGDYIGANSNWIATVWLPI